MWEGVLWEVVSLRCETSDTVMESPPSFGIPCEVLPSYLESKLALARSLGGEVIQKEILFEEKRRCMVRYGIIVKFV